MKRYPNNKEVAHAFVHQLSGNGIGSNLFFEGNTIYSYGYHFPIAKFIHTDVVLFTTKTYSISTIKHMSIVRSALSHLRVIYVHDINYPLDTCDYYEEKLEQYLGFYYKARKLSSKYNYERIIKLYISDFEAVKAHFPKIKVYKKTLSYFIRVIERSN